MASGARFEFYLDSESHWRWRFCASDSQRLAKSADSYVLREDVLNAITLVQAEAPVAAIQEVVGERRSTRLPWWWHLTLVFLAVVGAALVGHVARTSPQGPTIDVYDFARLAGGIILMAAVLGHYAIFMLLRIPRKVFKLVGDDTTERLWPPALIGLVESIMYPIAMLLDRHQFVGLWLGLKVAGQWGWWNVEIFRKERRPKNERDARKKEETIREKWHEGRRRYYQSLIGNALVVLWSAATYGVILMAAK